MRAPVTPEFSRLIEISYVSVIDAIFKDEKTKGHTLAIQYHEGRWRQYGVALLTSMPLDQLRGIINGTLAKDYYQGNPVLVKLYGKPTPSSQRVLTRPATKGCVKPHFKPIPR
jgi:hypothetical protein